MTTAPDEAPDGNPPGGTRVEMHAEARDSSTLTQIGQQINQPPPLPEQAFRPWAELAAPPGLANLPARPGLFVGRAGELARLDAALAGPGGVVVQAVHGLGGIGKSTLAAYWAAAHASDYTLTWWITAATPADIDAGLAALAVALQPALSGVLPLEALREGAVQWLAARSGWLLILDNVTGPADVAPLLARAPAGRYLITSRATGWHGTAVPVRLDVLDPAEARALLTGILTQDPPRDLDGTGELCAELGFLPLAIEQAGAYLAQAGATPREYLDLLARYPAAMYQAAAEGGDAARTIARIWHVTLDRLADDPLAGQVLRILAWYAPDAIPRTLLDGLADPPAVLRAIGRLAAYSMLTADAGTLAVHRLVQAVTRTPSPGDPHRDPQAIDDARDQATGQLADALPDWQDPAGWPGWRILLPHIDALASHAPPDTDTQATAYLLNQAGLFLDGQGQPGRAAGYLQRALADRLRVLGADHPDTLASRNNLAYAYQAAGDLGRAIPLYEQTLADSVRVLGADHPQTLASRNNLAYAYRGGGGPGPGHPAVRADPGRQRAGPGRRPPRHPGLAEQPRLRLPGGGGPGPGHPAVRADPGRPASGSWARTTPRPWSRGTTSPTPTRRRGTWAGPSRCTSRPWPTACGSWAPTTPTPWSRGTTSPAPTSRRGTWAGPSRCTSRPWPTGVRVLGADHPQTLASRNNLATPTGRGGPGPGHPAVRADPGRQRAGPGRRPPPDQGRARQPRRGAPAPPLVPARRPRCPPEGADMPEGRKHAACSACCKSSVTPTPPPGAAPHRAPQVTMSGNHVGKTTSPD